MVLSVYNYTLYLNYREEVHTQTLTGTIFLFSVEYEEALKVNK